MHYVFYTKYGLHKEVADMREESICSAASLVVLKDLYPLDFDRHNEYVKSLEHEEYRKGAEI